MAMDSGSLEVSMGMPTRKPARRKEVETQLAAMAALRPYRGHSAPNR